MACVDHGVLSVSSLCTANRRTPSGDREVSAASLADATDQNDRLADLVFAIAFASSRRWLVVLILSTGFILFHILNVD